MSDAAAIRRYGVRSQAVLDAWLSTLQEEEEATWRSARGSKLEVLQVLIAAAIDHEARQALARGALQPDEVVQPAPAPEAAPAAPKPTATRRAGPAAPPDTLDLFGTVK